MSPWRGEAGRLGQASARQNLVDDVDSERQDVAAVRRRAGEALDALAELIDDEFGRGRTHYPCNALA